MLVGPIIVAFVHRRLYRIEEFRCRGEVWQTAFEGLLERCDAAVLDLRGFDRVHVGTAYELFTVVKGSHQGKVLLLADASTNKSLLRDVVGAATEAGATAPQVGRNAVEINMVDVSERGSQLARRVLPLLAQQAGIDVAATSA